VGRKDTAPERDRGDGEETQQMSLVDDSKPAGDVSEPVPDARVQLALRERARYLLTQVKLSKEATVSVLEHELREADQACPGWLIKDFVEVEAAPLERKTSESGHVSRLLTAEQRRNLPKPRWLVENLLPERGVGTIFGPSASGKTFVAIDLAMRLANAGQVDWHGHVINEPGAAIYVAMEGAFDLQQRLDAWVEAHPHTSDRKVFTLVEEELNLADPASVQRLIDDIEAIDHLPKLIVIDTQAQAAAGADENSNTDMSVVMRNLRRLAVEFGCLVLTVHHTGWGTQNRARGASAQRAALDVEIGLMTAAGGRTLTFTKIRAAPLPFPLPFKLVPSGESAWAKPTKSTSDLLWRELTRAGQDGLTAKKFADLTNQSVRNAKRHLERFAESQPVLVKKVLGQETSSGREPDVYKLSELGLQLWAIGSRADLSAGS
jgi:hypothetical protein